MVQSERASEGAKKRKRAKGRETHTHVHTQRLVQRVSRAAQAHQAWSFDNTAVHCTAAARARESRVHARCTPPLRRALVGHDGAPRKAPAAGSLPFAFVLLIAVIPGFISDRKASFTSLWESGAREFSSASARRTHEKTGVDRELTDVTLPCTVQSVSGC